MGDIRSSELRNIIYDCFMGSGITAKMAKQLNRNYIIVSDEAPEKVVREAIRIKAKMLDYDTGINDIKVIRESDINNPTQS